MIRRIDSRLFVSWFGVMVVRFIFDRCQKQLLEWCFSLSISDKATLLRFCGWQPWHLHHNAIEAVSFFLLILNADSTANKIFVQLSCGNIVSSSQSCVFCLFLYTEPFVIMSVFFYPARAWIIGGCYVRYGAERAAERVGSNLGVDSIFIHWFGCGGLRWKNLLPFLYQSLQGRAAPDVLLIHGGGTWEISQASVSLQRWRRSSTTSTCSIQARRSSSLASPRDAGWRLVPIQENLKRLLKSVMATYVYCLSGRFVSTLTLSMTLLGCFCMEFISSVGEMTFF